MFRLSDVIQPLSESQIETLTSKAISRILHSEKAIAQSGMSHVSQETPFGAARSASGRDTPTSVSPAGSGEAALQAGDAV